MVVVVAVEPDTYNRTPGILQEEQNSVARSQSALHPEERIKKKKKSDLLQHFQWILNSQSAEPQLTNNNLL